MSNKKFDFKGGKLFPWHFQLVGLLLGLGGLAAIVGSPIIAPFFILIGALILTAYSGVEFDGDSFKEYNSFLFMKNGKKKRLGGVEKIFVNSRRMSQKIYTVHTNASVTAKNIEYSAYLKFENGIKIHLADEKNKGKLMERLGPLRDFFGTHIQDNT